MSHTERQCPQSSVVGHQNPPTPPATSSTRTVGKKKSRKYHYTVYVKKFFLLWIRLLQNKSRTMDANDDQSDVFSLHSGYGGPATQRSNMTDSIPAVHVQDQNIARETLGESLKGPSNKSLSKQILVRGSEEMHGGDSIASTHLRVPRSLKPWKSDRSINRSVDSLDSMSLHSGLTRRSKPQSVESAGESIHSFKHVTIQSKPPREMFKGYGQYARLRGKVSTELLTEITQHRDGLESPSVYETGSIGSAGQTTSYHHKNYRLRVDESSITGSPSSRIRKSIRTAGQGNVLTYNRPSRLPKLFDAAMEEYDGVYPLPFVYFTNTYTVTQDISVLSEPLCVFVVCLRCAILFLVHEFSLFYSLTSSD
jgi:hypothetical protein